MTDAEKSSKAPFLLDWRTIVGENYNTVYDARSPLSTPDGVPVYFRIGQRLYRDRHEFYELSDQQARITEGSQQSWDSLHEAVRAIQKFANTLLRTQEHTQEVGKAKPGVGNAPWRNPFTDPPRCNGSVLI